MAKSNPSGSNTSKATAAKAAKSLTKKTAGKEADPVIKEKILSELSKFHCINKYSAKEAMVAKACGLSHETKRFRYAKNELKSEGKITVKSGVMELSQAEIDKLKASRKGKVDADSLKTNEEYHNNVASLYETCEHCKHIGKLIKLLANGKSVTTNDAAQKMGYAIDSKAFRVPKAVLKENGHLEGTKEIRLTDEMFPLGRPKGN